MSLDESDILEMTRSEALSASPGIFTLAKPFRSEGGYSWSCLLPTFLCNDGVKHRTAFRLFEDDKPIIASSNAAHTDIAAMGGGRHAFWPTYIGFSASDNTDPNTNGRTYSLRRIPASPEIFTLAKPFRSEGGRSWSCLLPAFLCNDGVKHRAAFCLFEDDRPVTASSNATHADIAAMGGGRHAFWPTYIGFSTSDNTDPNSNGRTYTLRRVCESPFGVWPLGGCTIYNPAYAMQKAGLAFLSLQPTVQGTSPYSHTVGEHLQLIDYIRGVSDIAPELRPFCNMEFTPQPGRFEAALKNLDAVLVEECSDVEIVFRGTVLNRLRLEEATVTALRKGGDRELKLAARNWYWDGLLKVSPKREEFAAKILARMPHQGEANELLRAIIRETEPRRIGRDVFTNSVKRIGSVLGKPVGVMTHTHYYMPDGRPLSWPPTFHDDIIAACRANGIPVMHFCEVVARHGTGVALKEDLSHWRDDFMPVVGKAMADFAREVCARSR